MGKKDGCVKDEAQSKRGVLQFDISSDGERSQYDETIVEEPVQVAAISRKMQGSVHAFAEKYNLDDAVRQRLLRSSAAVVEDVTRKVLPDRVRNASAYTLRIIQGAEREAREKQQPRDDVAQQPNDDVAQQPNAETAQQPYDETAQ